MTLITVREKSRPPEDGFQASLSFDHGPEYDASVRDPFSPEDEKRLAWYFEEWLRFPFTEGVKAQAAAASISRFGEALFGQLFADPEAFAEYRAACQAGLERLAFEVAGSPEFHALHWEALKDPKLKRPFVLDAPMVRKNLQPQPLRARPRPSPTQGTAATRIGRS